MTTAITSLLLVVLAFVLVPVSVLLMQVVCAVMPRKPAPMPDVPRPCLTVLIPAHNESVGILATLDSVLPQLLKDDRLLVVADNCSDDTARISADAGAEVVERNDASRRGKGYALDFGVRHLERDPPQLVVIVDTGVILTNLHVVNGGGDRQDRTDKRLDRQACAGLVSDEGAGVCQNVGADSGIRMDCEKSSATAGISPARTPLPIDGDGHGHSMDGNP